MTNKPKFICCFDIAYNSLDFVPNRKYPSKYIWYNFSSKIIYYSFEYSSTKIVRLKQKILSKHLIMLLLKV